MANIMIFVQVRKIWISYCLTYVAFIYDGIIKDASTVQLRKSRPISVFN